MGTSPLIESISRSLDHWQFLYILAITVALLSTFAIVVFAFHIQEHKTGLKVSNYLYVIASVIAVVSTIVIVVKTRSLDTEKDRVAGVQIAQANQAAADANRKAEEAHNLSVQTANDNLKLQGQLAILSAGEQETEAQLSIRIIRSPQSLSSLLKSAATANIQILADGSEKESITLERQIANILTVAGIANDAVLVMGLPPNSPLAQTGVHCHFMNGSASEQFCDILTNYLSRHGIKADQLPYSEQEIAHRDAQLKAPFQFPDADATVQLLIGPKP